MTLPVTVALAVLLGLTACGTPEVAAPTNTPTAEAPSPTPTPTTEPPAAFTPACDTIVTAATLAEFTADGVSITPQAEFVAKMKGEGQDTYVQFDDNGGAICQTGNGTAAFEIYGYAKFPADQADALIDRLYGNDYKVDGFGDAEGQWFELPDDADGVDRVYLVLTTGTVVVGGSRDRVEEILEIAE
ncbi:hypothetical protein EYE40_02065 [Glaciihabitans arcticus]|uniref:Uncharacterized protein n=2 Tax=Glaciihabitans arcticus TaxID=2668039 RepID=A0A4Q9GRR3_9MICO|nr:hypothetical protein EYE40_02065 [Glaciihabitans arcticus]